LGPRNRNRIKKIREITRAKKYDYIVVRYIDIAISCGLSFDKKVILDLDDLPEQVFKSLKDQSSGITPVKQLKQLYYGIAQCSVRLYTKRAAKKCACVLLPNKAQCRLFPNALYLPNIPYPQNIIHSGETPQPERFSVLFVGTLDYAPNYLGLDHFLKNIWAAVLRELPQAHCTVVGSLTSHVDFSEKIAAWNSVAGVSVKGFVDDLVAEYAKNDIAVVPVYQGAGTHIKIPEAMSLGKATVITRYAARGFDDLLIDNENILIAHDDADFSAKIIQLLTDRDLSKRIGEQAKKSLANDYSFSAYTSVINTALGIAQTNSSIYTAGLPERQPPTRRKCDDF
jgi:glycosyltransferase involved in cell wall biosynthesis